MVSIIVPVYKSEKTLARCVDSLLSQTYEDIEILLVVDGPPDGSGVLAEELAKKDRRVRILNQKNQGVSSARNFGLREARGEYIRFVDSDDYVMPDSVEILVNVMEKLEVDLVIAGYHHQYFGRSILKQPDFYGEQKLLKISDKEYGIEKICIEGAHEQLEQLYQAGFLNMPWNKLFKKNLIQKHFRKELNLGEDLLFNLAYMKEIENFALVQASVCEYIQDDRGTTLSTKRREDKLKLTMDFYYEVVKAFSQLYPQHKSNKTLRDKLVSEFMDDVEGLAFEKDMTRKEKKKIIAMYQNQLQKVIEDAGEEKITLYLLDYRIIYFFMKRGLTNFSYAMIWLRGLLVKLLGKRG